MKKREGTQQKKSQSQKGSVCLLSASRTGAFFHYKPALNPFLGDPLECGCDGFWLWDLDTPSKQNRRRPGVLAWTGMVCRATAQPGSNWALAFLGMDEEAKKRRSRGRRGRGHVTPNAFFFRGISFICRQQTVIQPEWHSFYGEWTEVLWNS